MNFWRSIGKSDFNFTLLTHKYEHTHMRTSRSHMRVTKNFGVSFLLPSLHMCFGCVQHSHAHIRTYIHIYMSRYISTYMHTCMHTHIQTYTHTCMHTCTHASKLICPQPMHVGTLAYTFLCNLAAFLCRFSAVCALALLLPNGYIKVSLLESDEPWFHVSESRHHRVCHSRTPRPVKHINILLGSSSEE